MSSKLEIGFKDDNSNFSRITFWGNLDSFGLSEKRKDIMAVVNGLKKNYLVFDFSDLNFLNSESIGFLMQINEQLMESNKKLVLVNAKTNVLDVLKVIGLFETMPYYQTLDEFASSLNDAN